MAEVAKFAQPLDFTQVVFNKIQDAMRAGANYEYFEHVERLSDLLFPYYDDEFNANCKEKKIKPDLKNPWFDKASEDKKKDYARDLFKELIALIHRSGFLPYKDFVEVWE